MWIFTPDGFFSAVQHKDDPARIMIRTRARMHARKLIDACPEDDKPELVETPPPADYRFRVTVRRETWGYLVAKFATDIDYLNFKSEASKRPQPTGFMAALHGVWNKLLGFQDSMHDDTKKGRWGSISHGADASPFDGLDEWLDRRKSGSDDVDENEVEFEYVELAVGMFVQKSNTPCFGPGEIVSLHDDGERATVRFVAQMDDGTANEFDVRLACKDLWVLDDLTDDQVDEALDEIVPLSSRPDIETFDSIEELEAADDGSWPPPEFSAFSRGRR